VSDIGRAVDILRSGGLVAFPTETVYGLGADATRADAAAKIFAAKGRPATNPLIVHVADLDVARRYAAGWGDAAHTLAAVYWPGPRSARRTPGAARGPAGGPATAARRSGRPP
jgi:L-threonylcarbamoyladenylate synthase